MASATSLYNEVMDLLTSTGIKNQVFINKLLELKNPETKERELKALRNLLNEYQKLTSQIRKASMIMLNKETRKYDKLLNRATKIKKQIIYIIQGF